MANMTTHTGLPVAGYTPQADDKIALVNRNKEIEERLLRICDELRANAACDGRFVSIAITDFEKGFMSLNRAIFRPARIKLPGDAG